MCKRYYIEVTGLDDDNGEEQLHRAGISPDHILVIDDQATPLQRAIHTAIGVGMHEIRTDSRARDVVAARTLYVHFALLAGDSIDKVGRDTNRTTHRVHHYDREYNDRMFGDRDFRHASELIQQLLDQDPEWHPAKPSPRRLGRHRKHLIRRRAKPKPKQKTKSKSRVADPKNQLLIQFK